MSLEKVKKESKIKLLEENIFEKSNNIKIKPKKNKPEKELLTRCVSVYFTEDEYEVLTLARGDVKQAFFCRKIICEKLNKL